MLLRRKRVRVHLKDDNNSIEGLRMRRWPEFVVGVPKLITSEGTIEVSSPLIAIPRSNVSCYEVIE